MLGVLPEAAILAVKIILCALVSSAGAFLIISNWFDRKISGNEAILLFVGLLTMQSVGIWLSARSGLGLLLLAALVLGVPLALHGLGRRAERGLEKSLWEEDIAKFRSAIEIDPRNVAAHSLLADTYRRQGRLELAIGEYRAALQLDPTLRSERYWVQRLEAAIESLDRKEMACPRCHTPRPQGARVCPECRRPYSTIETCAHALKVMSSAQKAAWSGIVAIAFAAVGAAVALAPRVMAFLIGAAIVVAPLILIAANARMEAGDD